MSQATLFESVKRDVTGAIAVGRYGVGDVLPPVEALAAEHSCSTGTVRRALTELAEAGVVRRVRKKGTIVADQPIRGRVLVVLSNDRHTNALFQDSVYAAIARAGFDVELVPSTLKHEHLISRLTSHGRVLAPGDAVVWLHERVDPKLREAFQGRQIAFTYGTDPAGPPADGWVCPDLHRMAQLVVTHLRDLGHRRIAVASGPPGETTSWLSTTARYAKGLAEIAGLECRIHEMGDHATEQLIDWIRRGKASAYWAINDHEAMAWETRLLHEGLRTPDDISIVGRWGTPWAAAAPTPLTTVAIDPEAVADAVAHQLRLLRDRDTPLEPRHRSPRQQQLIEPRLEPAASTAPAPNPAAGR